MRAILLIAIAASAVFACQQVTDPQPSDAGVSDAHEEIPEASVELDASTVITSHVEH